MGTALDKAAHVLLNNGGQRALDTVTKMLRRMPGPRVTDSGPPVLSTGSPAFQAASLLIDLDRGFLCRSCG